MLRVPEAGRVENRCVDGAANPYLAISALIAAGLDGIERSVDPGEPCALNLLELTEEDAARSGLSAMPPTLWHALEAPRSRSRAARRAGQDPGRGLPRLLRRHQA